MATHQKEPIIGYHIDAKDAPEIGDRYALAAATGAGCFQWFARSPQSTVFAGPRRISDYDLEMADEHAGVEMCIHSPYILNLAGSYNPNVTRIVHDDLRICDELDGIGAVVHLGVNTAARHTVQHAETQVASNINRMLTGYREVRPTTGTARLLLENSSADANKLFSRIDRLGWLWSQITPANQEVAGFCLDTAHLWAASYDLRRPDVVRDTLEEFDRLVGLPHLRVVHLNDAKLPWGNTRDRHKTLGRGYIFSTAKGGDPAGLKAIVTECTRREIPMVCETKGPHDSEMDLVRAL